MGKKRFDNENIKIFQNDVIKFLKELPDESVDVITTDPAYSGMNQRMKFGNGRIVGKYQKEGNKKWFEEFHDTEENYRVFLSECKRVLKKQSHLYIMFDSFSMLTLAPLVREYFDVKNILVWDKVNLGMGHYFRRRHEFILFASKGKRELLSKSIPDVWKFKRIHKSTYPTQKPTEVFEAMLAGSIKEGDVVCDPFLGSGSAAIAAMKKNCNFFGCDINEDALNFSIERIKEFKKSGNDIAQPKPSSIDGEKRFW